MHSVLLDLSRLQHERIGDRHAAGVKKAFGSCVGDYTYIPKFCKPIPD